MELGLQVQVQKRSHLNAHFTMKERNTTIKKPYQCDSICVTSFETEHNLDGHMASVHMGKEPFFSVEPLVLKGFLY